MTRVTVTGATGLIGTPVVAAPAVWESLPDDGLPRFPQSRHGAATPPG